MRIDRQRIAAVEHLERLGWTFDGVKWVAPADAPLEPDWERTGNAMLAALNARVDALAGCVPGSDEAAELVTVLRVIEAYESAVDDAAVLQPPEAEAALAGRIAAAIKPILMPRPYDAEIKMLEEVDSELVGRIAHSAVHAFVHGCAK